MLPTLSHFLLVQHFNIGAFPPPQHLTRCPDGSGDAVEVVWISEGFSTHPSLRRSASRPFGPIALPLAVALRASLVIVRLGRSPSDRAIVRSAFSR